MRAVMLSGLCLLAGCGCPEIRRSIEAYHVAMEARTGTPEWADRVFADAAEDARVALAECEMTPEERLTVASVRARALVERGDFARAQETIAAESGVFERLDPSARHAGDVLGIALLKAAWHREPDRAFAEYVAVEDRATGVRARAFLDLRKVEALSAKAAAHVAENTPQARERARRALESAVTTCDAHRGDSYDGQFKALRDDLAARLEALKKS